MIALLRLNTDIPNDVFPSNCGHRVRRGGMGESAVVEGFSAFPSLSVSRPLLPPAPHYCTRAPNGVPKPPSTALAHVSEVWLLAGAFPQEALTLNTALPGALDPVGTGQGRQLSSSPSLCTLP